MNQLTMNLRHWKEIIAVMTSTGYVMYCISLCDVRVSRECSIYNGMYNRVCAVCLLALLCTVSTIDFVW